MRISEIYGPVRQGEGALLGVAMPFVRTAACNLSCSWCDSRYTWEPGYTYTNMTVDEIMARIEALGGDCQWVALTGGEPTIQPDAGLLVSRLAERELQVIVETNGLRLCPWFAAPNVFVSCSPKLPASGQDTPARRRKVARLAQARMASPALRARSQWKFVIATEADLEALVPYCADVGIDLSGAPDSIPVYVQPDGYIQPIPAYLHMLGWLQDHAPAGVRVTPQVHRLVHGPDARGV
jgi:7-cyano-7-deazaguanosine (preQ0) biosynthesis protein QueE